MHNLRAGIVALGMFAFGCDEFRSWDAIEQRFTLRVENVSGSGFPTVLGDGVWIVHSEPGVLFREGEVDRGEGLEALAEDADSSVLSAVLDPSRSGVTTTLPPGKSFEIEILARPDATLLTFAAMIVESNDVFIAPSDKGIPLFDEEGRPIEGDVSYALELWNAGTEADQPPRFGSTQRARQLAPGIGAREGAIRPWDHPLRALPIAPDLVDVRVSIDGKRVIISVDNVAIERGVLRTQLSPFVWALHDGSLRLFTPKLASGRELESFAEDGATDVLASTAASDAAVRSAGVAQNVERGDIQRFELELEPDAQFAHLSIAARLIETNDAFVANDVSVRLVADNGELRDAEQIQRDLMRALAVWDAGTEDDEVPGLGRFQSPRQPAPNSGPADPTSIVHAYAEAGDDMIGDALFRLLSVDVTHVEGTIFEVRIVNTSGESPSPLMFTQFVHAVHDANVRLFDLEAPASAGIEELAEDCLAGALRDELAAVPGVRHADVTLIPDAATEPGPILPGMSFTFHVEADATHRFLSLASMPFPSNDAFVAFGPEGIALLDEDGSVRTDAAIALDVRSLLRAWDAGTEANQAGGAGSHQSPHQTAADVGTPEGGALVRRQADPVWSYPAADEIVRITLTPH